jgi:hypothetical protein
MDQIRSNPNLVPATIGPRPQATIGPANVATIGSANATTIGPSPQKPTPGALQARDTSTAKPNQAAKESVISKAVANRLQVLQSAPAELGKIIAEAKATIVVNTLVEDFARISVASVKGDHAEIKKALASLEQHAGKLLGDKSFSGGMLCGIAKELSHLVESGCTTGGIVAMVGLTLVQCVPFAALPVNTTLMLVGGVTAYDSLSSAYQAAKKGDTYQAGQDAAKALISVALGRVANKERSHALHHMMQGKMVVLPGLTSVNATALRNGMTKLITELRTGKATANETLRLVAHAKGAHAKGPSQAAKAAHSSETGARFSSPPVHDDKHGHHDKGAVKAHGHGKPGH